MDDLKLAKYPKLPGVYIMKDEDQKVIYVGKAKNIQSRLNNYFLEQDTRYQVQFLVSRVKEIETIVTDTEEQALILERDLINRYKPKYNIRLKDDKAYLSIKINEETQWPRLELVRRIKQDDAKYWGPYTSSYEVRELLQLINRLIPLRTCTDVYFNNRTRPCLEYEIKRCLGPCCLKVDPIDYNDQLKKAEAILSGKTEFLEKELVTLMDRASENLQFEDAGNYRDKLEILKNFKVANKYLATNTDNKDVFAIYREGTLVCLSIMNVINGRIANNKNFSFEQVAEENDELLMSAIFQYFSDKQNLPQSVIVPFELKHISVLKSFFKDRGNIPDIVFPKKGLNFRLLKLAEINAEQHFKTLYDEEKLFFSMAQDLVEVANLKKIPRNIECIDISNLQGSDIVGAVVAFKDGVPNKKNYKKYIIRNRDMPNDFASIQEVLRRRVPQEDLPDLFLIDGGTPQLRAAQALMDEIGCGVPCIAIAKERDNHQERLVIGSETVILDKDKPLSKLLMRIRDEVHRFVITFHRLRRSKRVVTSILDDVPGLGIERKTKLLKAYGSPSNIASVSKEEVSRLLKISPKVAEKIINSIKERLVQND